MRFVFLFLLLLNILYALWQLQDGNAVESLYEAADQALERTPGTDGRRDADEETVVPIVGEGRPATVLCVSLGVFASEPQAEQLRQRLLALSIQSAVVSRNIVDSQQFSLIMLVQGGQEEAMQRLSQLQDDGIDSFIITLGPLANNLSLGVFSREDHALARQVQLEAMGYSVRMQSQETSRSEYLVQVDSAARRLFDKPLLAGLRGSFPALQQQFLPCQAVAP